MPHIHEKYDFTVTAYIVYKGKVLLVNHPRYNKWFPIGGHIELDEDPDQALYREIQEETGLKVEILATKPSDKSPETKFMLTPSFVNVHEANPPHKHITLVYFARAENDHHILSAEHTDMQWLNEEELENPKYGLSETNKFYAREAIRLAKA